MLQRSPSPTQRGYILDSASAGSRSPYPLRPPLHPPGLSAWSSQKWKPVTTTDQMAGAVDGTHMHIPAYLRATGLLKPKPTTTEGRAMVEASCAPAIASNQANGAGVSQATNIPTPTKRKPLLLKAEQQHGKSMPLQVCTPSQLRFMVRSLQRKVVSLERQLQDTRNLHPSLDSMGTSIVCSSQNPSRGRWVPRHRCNPTWLLH